MARNTRRNYTYFEAEINGTHYEFKCWGTYGSHMCEDQDGRRSRYSYGNRPWESFRFETVLSQAIKKCPKADRPELEVQILKKTREAEEARCNEQLADFKRLHDGLSQENKDRLANSGIVMHDESDVQAVMGLMSLMTLMQG